MYYFLRQLYIYLIFIIALKRLQKEKDRSKCLYIFVCSTSINLE